jgi:fructose-1-phosphate kinase PfkB-like protein
MTSEFENIFGLGATQTATQIVLSKADLPMTAAAENGGEQALAAILKKAMTNLSVARFDGNIEQNITIESGSSGQVTRKEDGAEVPYRKYQIVISFYERDEQINSGINPDKY